MDLTLLTRYQSLLGSLLPRWLNAWRLERKLNRRFDHARYGLLPTYR
ncbi:hypothetical protein chiPu_0029739, partial [Chiloscyllium punctatum]|nr:hypothetical protein [Chiloscyllium punctatum]